MTNLVVTGYASIDYAAVLDGFFAGDRTVMIRERDTGSFPRAGGSPLYVSRPVANAGQEAYVLTWVGDDSMGQTYREQAKGYGIRTDGIATVAGGNTPACIMLYQSDGSCGCCFDPGMLGQERLQPHQAELVRNADILCITVGPPEIGLETLQLVQDKCKVAWVAKNDPLSFPAPLLAALGQHADYIFCNVQERDWIEQAIETRKEPAPMIIQTNGSRSVQASHGAQTTAVDVQPLVIGDPTGAGDTLAGGCLQAIMEHETSLEGIVRSGISAAGALLSGRVSRVAK